MSGDLTFREKWPHLKVGAGTYGGLSIQAWRTEDLDLLEIGSYCSFAAGSVILIGGEHRTDWVTTYPFSARWQSAKHIEGHPANRGPVAIGSDVWVGAGAMILSGTEIGTGSVVGACTVVRGKFAPYSIIGGNPGRFLGYRFEEQTREALLRIAWWSWPTERIEKAMPLLLSPDIETFIRAAEKGEI